MKIQVPSVWMHKKSGEIFLCYDVFERFIESTDKRVYFKFIGLIAQDKNDEIKHVGFDYMREQLFLIGHFGEGGS